MKEVAIVVGEYAGKMGKLTGVCWGAGMCIVQIDDKEIGIGIKDVRFLNKNATEVER